MIFGLLCPAAEGGSTVRSGKRRLVFGVLLAVLLLCLWAFGAAESGVEYDEDGGVWDYNKGTYTTPDGQTVNIRDEDNNEPVVQNEDGSITIVNDGSDVIRNPDGSITVESGQLPITEAPEESNALTGDEAWAQGMLIAAEKNGNYTPTVYRQEDGSVVRVEVVYMGLARSMVRLNGENVLVNTCDLAWETSAPEDQVLAVVSCRNYARIRVEPNKKSLILDRCYRGFVVRVIKVEKNWTLIDYKGIRGYVMNSSLTLCANEPREYRTGWVATKSGKIKGTSTVHVRNDPKEKQQEEYPVGTPITIFAEEGDWCYIEVEGHLCYIMKKFTLYDDAQTASSEGSV